ncbi:MAG: hypothetical protein K2X91_17300, partial [Thermoleophilia bacterium]|nr:hypothetical protein [Thermoleophilia bacterium]
GLGSTRGRCRAPGARQAARTFPPRRTKMTDLLPADDASCDRCGSPFGPRRFTLRVEPDPPETQPIEVWICEECVESMGRWMLRRQGSRPPDPDSDPRIPGTGRASGGGRRSRRVSRYADVLDRQERHQIRYRRLLIGGCLALFAAVLGLIYAPVISDAIKAFRERRNRPAPPR